MKITLTHTYYILFALIFSFSAADGAFSQTLLPGVYDVPGTLPLIGDNQSIGSNTTVNLFNGGTIGEFFQAGTFDGSDTNIEVNIFDGNVGDFFTANSGSVVNISGGIIGEGFAATNGSQVNISGGTSSPGGRVSIGNGSEANISGGAFAEIGGGSDSIVNISGGTSEFLSVSGETNISGGVIFVFEGNGNVNITNGTIEAGSFSNGSLHISGGSIGFTGLQVGELGLLSATGGSIALAGIASGGQATISGGSLTTDGAIFEANSQLGFVGTSFAIDSTPFDGQDNSIPLSGLTPGMATTIADRDVLLTGVLADGSLLNILLNTNGFIPVGVFQPGSLVTVTLVPEPSTLLLGTLAIAGLLTRRRKK